jgi:hypothetical protein
MLELQDAQDRMHREARSTERAAQRNSTEQRLDAMEDAADNRFYSRVIGAATKAAKGAYAVGNATFDRKPSAVEDGTGDVLEAAGDYVSARFERVADEADRRAAEAASRAEQHGSYASDHADDASQARRRQERIVDRLDSILRAEQEGRAAFLRG